MVRRIDFVEPTGYHGTGELGDMRGRRMFRLVPLPKFVIHRSNLRHELRKQEGHYKYMMLVPLFDLKSLTERAASDVGTSNQRH